MSASRSTYAHIVSIRYSQKTSADDDDHDEMTCLPPPNHNHQNQQQQQQQHQLDLYEFTPTIDVLSDGSEQTSVTLFLSIWRRRRRRPTTNHEAIHRQSDHSARAKNVVQQPQNSEPMLPTFTKTPNDDDDSSSHWNDLGVLVRRFALTGVTNALGRLAADQGYALSSVQAVVCPLIANHTNSSSSSSSPSSLAPLEGLASLLLALHQGGTLHKFTVILVPFSLTKPTPMPSMTSTRTMSRTSSSCSSPPPASANTTCPVEQIAKLMLDGKHTTSSCPLRTCHVPIIPPSSSSTSNDEANNILQQQSDQQPWWLVHQDDHLSIHTKIVVEKAAATTASSNSNDVVVLFWYTLWCCDSLTLNNMAHVDLETESSTATSQQPPYNLGVAVMPEMYAPHQIQEWFQQIPERFLTTPTKQPLSSTTASSSSSLDALLLVGPELETFLLSSSSSFPWVPLVLVASTTTTTTTSRTPFSLTADAATSTPGPVITASTDGGGILFRRAYQQAQWLQTKFPRHLFLTRLFSSSFTRQSAAFAPSSRENDDPTNGCSTLPCSIISLVSGTSVILSSSLSSTDGAESKCQVIHRTIGSFREEMNEPEQLLRVNSMQQALQDYLDSSRCSTVTAGTTSCSSLTLIASSHLPVPFQSATNHLHHHHLPDLKDGNEIDLEEDDTSIEQANHEYSGRDCQDNHFPRNHQFHFQQLHVSNMRNNDQSNDRQAALPPTAHTTAAVEVDATSFVPHLLVLGTGCASPSPLRGSSAYGLFLPHVVRDTASPSKANGHGDGKMPTVRGLHLILTAVLECGEDVVSQLYRFLPPPPPNVSPDAQLDHNAWFHYQLRQICFIWISHAHLDHYGGLPTLLRRIHEAHHLIQHTREQRPISHPPHDEHAAKRFKRGDENGFLNICSPNDCYRPLVIAPPRVLAYLQALLIPADMYDGVTQADYDRSQTWQRWVTEITLTTTVRTTCPCKSNFTRTATRGANEVHLDNYRDYRPFSFLRNVPVDHGCAHAYGLFLGLAPCLWYSERERNLLPPSHGNNHHPRFGDPHSRVLCFSGDTLPCRRLVTQSPKIPTMNNHFSIQPNVEWLIHEATFDDKKQDMAQTKGHSTSLQALDMAQQLNAKLCLLTHFSQRYRHTIPYALPLAPHDNDNNDKTGRFPRALFAFDGLYLPLLIHSAMN